MVSRLTVKFKIDDNNHLTSTAPVNEFSRTQAIDALRKLSRALEMQEFIESEQGKKFVSRIRRQHPAEKTDSSKHPKGRAKTR